MFLEISQMTTSMRHTSPEIVAYLPKAASTLSDFVVPGFAEKPSFLRNRLKSLSTLGFEKSSFATSRIFRSLFSWPKPRSEKPSDRRLFREFRTNTQSEACQSILMTSAVQTGLYFRARHTGYHDAIYAVSACSVLRLCLVKSNRTLDSYL
jgi:hypothetical protein